jgi:type I restriction enzyme, S subunit
MSDELPEGWADACLADVADVSLGKMLDKAKRTAGTPLPYLRNANVRWGAFDLSDLLVMPFEPHELDRFALRRGDVLICEGGEPGRAAVWPGHDEQIRYQKALLRGRLRGDVEPAWLMLALRQAALLGELEQYFTGSTIKHFPQESALTFRFPLAPASEQRRIVEAVEALLAQVNAAKARLGRVTAILKRFRRAVLAAACSGRLTDEEGPIVSVPLTKLLAEPLANGRSVPDAVTGFPVLRLTALKAGKINLGESKIGAWSASEAERFLVRRGDFLVSRGNGSLSLVARGGLVDCDPQPVAFPDTMIRIRPNQKMLKAEYLAIVWAAPEIRLQIEASAHTTAGIHKVSQKDLAGIEVPLPHISTQTEIVRRVEALFALADKIEQRVAAATARAEKAPQAILAKAFRGELVPTEADLARAEGRTYETAEELLERVKADHQADGGNGVAGKKRRGARRGVGEVGTAASSVKRKTEMKSKMLGQRE